MKILGISCFYHDSAASLVVDGKILAAAEEERFSRIKHDSAFPSKAVKYCLNEAKIKGSDLDYVVFYEKPFEKFERITLTHLQTAPHSRSSFASAYTTFLGDKLWIKTTISKEVGVPVNKILFCDHHLSHAASSFYTSKFKRSALFTCDGVGEWNTTTWGLGEGNKIKLYKKISFPHSLGLFYSTFTQYLGFQVNEGEFKVMGLAPYGKPKYKQKLLKLIDQVRDGSFRLNMDYFDFHVSEKRSYSDKLVKLIGFDPRDPSVSEEIPQKYADLAASVQEILDDTVVLICKNIYKETKSEFLCYSGGVALNGVTNWRILKETKFEKLHIHPAAGDSGGALGAALYLYYNVLNNLRVDTWNSAYLGRENTDKEIINLLKFKKAIYKKLHRKELLNIVSTMLSNGKVVGWVQGKFEWGPRALGNRSILADPRSIEMKNLVNSKIKFREGFRPFAPVVLHEMGQEYFDLGKIGIQEPLSYMIAVVPVKKKYQKNLGAITHVDGTARPQFVTREENALYYDLIKEFGKKTGINVLLNTSFNLKGEPIVNTAEDAWNTFCKSGLDALVLGSYLIFK